MLGVFVAMAVGYPAWTFAQSMFFKPLQAEFGWSRSQIAFAFHASVFLVFMAPVMGRVVDRVGVKRVLIACMTAVALIYVGLANMSGAYGWFVALHLALFFFGIGTSGVAFTRAVTSWFSTSLGTALAVSRIGLSLFGAGLPVLVYYVIAEYGWRAGYYLMAALALLVGLPVSWLLVRDRRGPSPVAGAAAPARAPSGLRLWLSLLRNRRVVTLSIAAACTYGPTVAILTQLQPLLTDKGLDPALAAQFSGLLAISVLCGTLVTGVLVDRIWAPLVACVFTIIPAVGVALLLPGSLTAPMTAFAVIMIGLAQGAEIDVVAYMTARYFGMTSYAAIYGLSVLFIGLATAGGGILFALSHDWFGSYNPGLIGAGVVFLTGAVAYLSMGRYPDEAQVA